MRALGLGLVCACALVVVEVATATTPPVKTGLPASCAAFLPLAAASAASGTQFTSVTQVKSYPSPSQGITGTLGCNYVATPSFDDSIGKPTGVNLSLYAFTSPAAMKKWFAGVNAQIVPPAAGRIAKAPQCQSAWTGIAPQPSFCAVLQPFGPNSFEYDGAGISYMGSKFALNDCCASDVADEGIMRAAIARLPK